MKIEDITTQEQFDDLLNNSQNHPTFLLKHSTRCPISSRAMSVYANFAEKSEANFYRVLVVESRDLSLYIADNIGLQHQSPQAILFFNKKIVWHASHNNITNSELSSAILNIK